MIVELGIRILTAGILGGLLLYGSMHLLGWPDRVVRRWEDQMLLDEIAQAEQHYTENAHPSSGAYLAGLQTAAIMLGTAEPKFRQDRQLRRRSRA